MVALLPHSILVNTRPPPPPVTTTTVTCFSSSSSSSSSSSLVLPNNTCSSSSRWRSCYSINPPISSRNYYRNDIGISRRRRRLGIVCMAKERRVKMVAKQIQRELSDMLLTDQVLQYAILPEAALGADRYLSSLTTISDVEVSSDLQVVKVYVSVFGDERGKEVAISGLKSKAKYVRGQLGKRMKLRLTPEIRFIEDESLERGSRVIAILDKIKGEKKSEENPLVDQDQSLDLNDESEDWEDDDPDDDIIYVK